MKKHSLSPNEKQFLQACCDAGLWGYRNKLEETSEPVSPGSEDQVERITIQFHRVRKIHRNSIDNPLPDPIVWDYKEKLSIDRASGILEQVQTIGEEGVVSHKYYVPDGIQGLLDCLDITCLLEPMTGLPNDLIEDPDDHRFYEIEIAFQSQSPCKYSGYYDRYGLPSYWPDLMDSVEDFINSYGNGEIANSFLYGAARRRKSDYIFCSVCFEKYGSTYHYLTTDDTIKPGDRVVVPVGKTNIEKVAAVTKVEYFQAEQAPFPLEKVKTILRRLESDESNHGEEESEDDLSQGIMRLQTALFDDDDDRTEETLLEILYALQDCVARNETLLLPVGVPSAFYSTIAFDGKGLADMAETQLLTVTLGTGEKAFAAFTDIAELEEGPAASFITCDMPAFFENVLEVPDTAGIVLDPWSGSFYLSKPMLKIVLDTVTDSAEEPAESSPR